MLRSMNALARTLLLPLVAGALAVAAQPAAAAKLDTPWTGSGPGTLKPVPAGADADAQLDYQAPGAFNGSWSYSAVAGSTRTLPVEYQASGFYGWYAVRTKLERFVVRGGKEISTLQLAAQGPTNCCDAPSGGFTYKGKTTFEVEKGDVYGLRMSGDHFTSGPVMSGSIVLREVDSTPPVITPVVTGKEGANGFHTGPVKVEWKLADDDSRHPQPEGLRARDGDRGHGREGAHVHGRVARWFGRPERHGQARQRRPRALRARRGRRAGHHLRRRSRELQDLRHRHRRP